MDKKLPKSKTRRSSACRRDNESNSSTSQQSSVSAKDVRTATKRKSSPDTETKAPRKRQKMSKPERLKKTDEDLRIRVLKRKRDDSEEPSEMTKTKRFNLDQGDEESASSSVDSVRESSSDPLEGCSTSEEHVGLKRKAHDEEEGPKRKRSSDPEEDTEETQHELAINSQRAAFEAKYKQEEQLGQGGCGSVYAGYRKEDHLPVAIKHIKEEQVFCKHVDQDGNQLSAEVAIMLELQANRAGSVGRLAPVSLLDWYDLDQELILVLERPVPCVDLLTYTEKNRGVLSESKAKIIMKQLLDASKELEDQQIFHRDIKVENILIETGTDVPRVRIIDFGLSCFFKNTSSYQVFYGTSALAPPEWLRHYCYTAGPTTVWQLGAVLFELLHRKKQFQTTKFLKKKLKISKRLSQNCQDFLRMCLNEDPEQRPTLRELQLHPWLR